MGKGSSSTPDASREKMRAVRKVKQLTVWVESAHGGLARIGKALAEAKVNIVAFSAHGAGPDGTVRLVLNNTDRARKALEKLGVRITEEEVLRVTMPDKPGRLAKMGARLAAVKINIEYAYTSLPRDPRHADLVLGVSDVTGAAKALRDF